MSLAILLAIAIPTTLAVHAVAELLRRTRQEAFRTVVLSKYHRSTAL